MAKRSAEVDLTRPSDTESGEDDDREGPNQWRTWMTTMIIGAWIWWGEAYIHRPPASVEDWGEELIAKKHFKFLLHREAFIPDLLPSDHPFIKPKFTRPQYTRWEPQYDYTIFFMRSQQDDNVDLELLAVAELRWVADGGILSMDSHANITAHNNRILAQNPPKDQEEKPGETTKRKHPRMMCRPAPPADHISASRVDSIPPTQKSVDLLTCLENWNGNQPIPPPLKSVSVDLKPCLDNWNGKILPEKLQFPTPLLHLLVEYTLATWVHLVISSICPYLETRCHFATTRRLKISVDTDIRAVLYSFLYASDFALMARDTQGKLHDFSVLSSLPARDLCMLGEREIRLQVQAKLWFSHECDACGESFRCIPQGCPAPEDCIAPPDNKEGCACVGVRDTWWCSSACYFGD